MAVINTNITSLIGQQNLNKSANSLQTAMERLSSGSRINSAKDDAAGQAIANRMSSQITGLNQASRNANDGISVAQTTEGALNQVNDNLQRIRELSVQAANGTNSAEDKASIQNEINQRLSEIDRVSKETDFNGTKVLSEDRTLSIQVGSKDGQAISINLQEINSQTLGLGNFQITGGVDTTKYGTSDVLGDAHRVGQSVNITIGEDANGTPPSTTGDAVFAVKDGGGYAVKASNGSFYAAAIDSQGKATYDSSSTAVDATDVDIESGEVKSVKTEASLSAGSSLEAGDEVYAANSDSGAAESFIVKGTDSSGQDAYYAAKVSSDGTVEKGGLLQVGSGNVTANPLDKLDNAISKVDGLRSDLGAIQNRFDSAIENLSTTTTNMSSARSRIEDADYAVEVSNMTRAQILQQAGTSVLAQANQVPQGVLSLLQ